MLFRQHGHVAGGQAEAGDGDRYIGFASSEGGNEFRRLEKSLQPGRRQAQHDLSKRHHKFRH